jgi:hypothetical protein
VFDFEFTNHSRSFFQPKSIFGTAGHRCCRVREMLGFFQASSMGVFIYSIVWTQPLTVQQIYCIPWCHGHKDVTITVLFLEWETWNVFWFKELVKWSQLWIAHCLLSVTGLGGL